MNTVLLVLQTLDIHGEDALLYFSVRECLEVARQPDLFATCNEPLSRIPLVPFDSVSIVHRELVVKVMIPLAEGHNGGDEVISRCQLIVERRFTKPMR